MSAPALDAGGDERDASTPIDAPLASDAATACESPGATLGDACDTDEDCDDACFCDGVERCVEGTCAAGDDPCEDTLAEDAPACVIASCDEGARRCGQGPDHARCDDGEPCNGAESCSLSLGCIAGEEPSCDDASACTLDACEPGVGCVHVARDLDADGHADVRCGGDDCDDDPRTGTATYPGVGERCENRRDDDCDGALDYEDTDCVATNDDCASARVIGAGTLSGTTRGLDGDIALSCAADGPDAVYRFHLDARADVRAEARMGSTPIALALRPLAACGGEADLRCSARTAPALFARDLAAGDYALVVQTPLPGPFVLTLEIEPATTLPEADTCAPTTQVLAASVTLHGRFDEVTDDLRPACRDDGGAVADAVYRLEITEPSDVVITASTSEGDALYLSLVGDCASTRASIACSVDRAPIVRRRALAAGTYFVAIEPESPAVVEYAISAQIAPAVTPMPGDACASAIDAPLDGRVVIPVSSLLADGGTSCGGGSDRDATLRLMLDAPRDVRVRARADAGGAPPMIALRTACDAPESDLACGAETLDVRALDAGEHTLVVTTGASSGELVIDVETSAPSASVPGDHCERAVDVSAGARISATLAGAGDDLRAATCANWGAPDAFYRLSLTAERRVLVFAESDVDGLLSVALLEGACAGTELVCRTGTSPAFERVLPAGEYVLAVEGAQPVPGAYRLRVVVEAP